MTKVSRRSLLKVALGMPAAAWLLNYRAIAAPHTGQVKITKIKTLGLDNVGDGCLIRIETDAGIIGYGEAGLPSAAARTRIQMAAPQLVGQDPLAIERYRHRAVGSRRKNHWLPDLPATRRTDSTRHSGLLAWRPRRICSIKRSARHGRIR